MNNFILIMPCHSDFITTLLSMGNYAVNQSHRTALLSALVAAMLALSGCYSHPEWTRPPSPPLAAALEAPEIQDELVMRMILNNIARYKATEGINPIPSYWEISGISYRGLGSKTVNLVSLNEIGDENDRAVTELHKIYLQLVGLETTTPIDRLNGIQDDFYRVGGVDDIDRGAVLNGRYQTIYVWVMPDKMRVLEVLAQTVRCAAWSGTRNHDTGKCET